MIERWTVPLPAWVLELTKTMPRTDGYIVDPLYLPPGKMEPALEEWRKWVRANCRKPYEQDPRFPPFLKAAALRAHPTRRNAAGNFTDSTPLEHEQ